MGGEGRPFQDFSGQTGLLAAGLLCPAGQQAFSRGQGPSVPGSVRWLGPLRDTPSGARTVPEAAPSCYTLSSVGILLVHERRPSLDAPGGSFPVLIYPGASPGKKLVG